jgi:sugar phosphate isomerase/epimerase
MLAMTSDFHGESRNTAEIQETLARIAGAGFSHVHWCHEWTGYYLYSTHEMLQIRSWCDALDLKVKGVHATCGMGTYDEGAVKNYASPLEYNRLAGVELVRNRVDLAHTLDAGAIVLHFPLPWRRFEEEPEFREAFYRQALRSFDELEAYCTTRRIRVCVENDNACPPPHTRSMYDTLFDRYGGDYLGLCFDTGHANMTCEENVLEYAERYRDRLFMIHLHDNHGRTDEHLLPFEGGFDWEGFAPLLAHSVYEFPLLMEPSLKSAENETAWLKKAYEAGARFYGMVLKHRPGSPPLKKNNTR